MFGKKKRELLSLTRKTLHLHNAMTDADWPYSMFLEYLVFIVFGREYEY